MLEKKDVIAVERAASYSNQDGWFSRGGGNTYLFGEMDKTLQVRSRRDLTLVLALEDFDGGEDGDTLYGETTVLDKWESTSKDDRGVVHVETIGYNQDGKVVCIFRRKVMVPKDNYLEARGGEQPGRPVPQPDKNWPGPDAKAD